MPQDIEDCVKAVGNKAEEPYALCNWMKSNGKGYFAHGERFDIDAAVKEFKEHGAPLVEPPIVVGHEEEQELLKNTGIPSVGWVVGLRRRGPTLYSDLAQIFPSIARLIEIGAFKHVSPEIYPRDNPPEGVNAKGCMLRRLALLGGQLPHIKSLADLPAEAWGRGKGRVIMDVPIFEAGEWQGENYSLADLDDMVRNFNLFSRPSKRFDELARVAAPRVRLTASRRVWQDSSRTWACFSEVTAMAEDAVQQVAEAAIAQSFPGLPQEFIASLTPDQMGMLATAIAPTEAPTGEEGHSTGMAEWPEGMDRASVIAALVAQGQDQATLEAMSDEELIGLYTQTMGVSLAEEIEEEPIVASTATPTPAPVPARRQPTKVTTTQQFSEERLTLLEKRLQAAEREQRRRERLDRLAESNKKKAAVRAFCEQLAKNGKASPAEVEFDVKTGEPLGALAFALSAASAVRKFSEGKEGKSDLEMLMDKLEQRPVRKFAEQVPDPVQGNQGGQLSQERREQLLKLTSRGRSVLAKESERKQTAKMFAEQLAGVLGTKLNGQG